MTYWLFMGLGLSGFAIMVADLLCKVPLLGAWLQPVYVRFFPPVEEGLGLLISSIIFVLIAVAISVVETRSDRPD